MAAAIGLITIGGILIASALKGVGITDLIAGAVGGPLNPAGGTKAFPDDATVLGDPATAPDGTQVDTGDILSSIQKPGQAGSPVAHGTSVSGIHQTAGLPGYPARDYMAPSGSPVVSPVNGHVTRLSGHSPAMGPISGPHGPLGWSVYIRGDNGHSYFLTHMGTRTVHVGQKLVQGQVIGTVADYAKYGTPSHIHMGVH